MNRSKLKSDIAQNELSINVSGIKKLVKLSDYVFAKTKGLIEFGYSGLTPDEVKEQLNCISDNSELTVIGLMIEGDLDY